MTNRNRHHFCTPMKRHYITKAASNSAMALSMASELQAAIGYKPGVQDFVEIINKTAISLIKLCEDYSSEENIEL